MMEREADKTLRGHEREADPTAHVTDFLRTARPQGPGDNLPQMSPSGPQTPPACPMPHASPTHTPPHGQLPCMLITC